MSECILAGETVFLREAVVLREGRTRRVIEICAPEHLELALAREIRARDPEHRPIRTSRAFTLQWAEEQLACSNPDAAPTRVAQGTKGPGELCGR